MCRKTFLLPERVVMLMQKDTTARQRLGMDSRAQSDAVFRTCASRLPDRRRRQPEEAGVGSFALSPDFRRVFRIARRSSPSRRLIRNRYRRSALTGSSTAPRSSAARTRRR